MSEYFSKPFKDFRDIKVRVDLSNYATKADIKNITNVDTTNFALKTNLANLKTEVDKLDMNKLVPVPTDLSKLSNVVKNDIIKKTEYNKLVNKIINIDTRGVDTSFRTKSFKHQSNKMVKHTQTICLQFVYELFECV